MSSIEEHWTRVTRVRFVGYCCWLSSQTISSQAIHNWLRLNAWIRLSYRRQMSCRIILEQFLYKITPTRSLYSTANQAKLKYFQIHSDANTVEEISQLNRIARTNLNVSPLGAEVLPWPGHGPIRRDCFYCCGKGVLNCSSTCRNHNILTLLSTIFRSQVQGRIWRVFL